MTMTPQMTDAAKAPRWAMIAGALGAIWYAFGLMQFWLGFSTDTAAAVASGAMTDAHAAAVAGTPLLVWGAFALASGLGLLGSIALLRGAPMAATFFAASLVCAVAYYLWVYGLSGTGAVRPSEEIIIALVVVAVTAGFAFFSRKLR